MRRVVTLGTAWLVAAVAATAVAWQGIGVVGDQVTDERPRPLSAAEVEAALDPPELTPPPDDPGAPTTTAPGPSPSTTSPPRATTTTTAPARPGATTTTTAQAQAPTTSTTRAPAAETRTYNLVGGSTALRFSPSGVTVLWANPNPGFSVDTGSGEGSGGVEVEFRSDTHRSEVHGWWDNGPRDEVDEEAASDSESEH